jgi:hypothetical protein
MATTPSENVRNGIISATKNVSDTITKINPANYGENIKNSFPIITYFVFSVVYVMAFVAIYIKNAALIGIALLYVINIIYSIFIIKDMFLSKKVEQIITFILTAILLLNMVSSTMIAITFKGLHAKFNKTNNTMKLSNANKQKMSVYFTMFITTIVFTWVLALFYFGEGPDVNFFNYIFIGKSMYPKLSMAFLIVKICICIAGLGLSAYMVFLANNFLKLRRSQYME